MNGKRWVRFENKLIRHYAFCLSDYEMSVFLLAHRRTPKAVQIHRLQLGLLKKQPIRTSEFIRIEEQESVGEKGVRIADITGMDRRRFYYLIQRRNRFEELRP